MTENKFDKLKSLEGERKEVVDSPNFPQFDNQFFFMKPRIKKLLKGKEDYDEEGLRC